MNPLSDHLREESFVAGPPVPDWSRHHAAAGPGPSASPAGGKGGTGGPELSDPAAH